MRCDVVTKGQPCSRCSNTRDECQLFPSKRLQGKKVPYPVAPTQDGESHAETGRRELGTSPEVPRMTELPDDESIPVTANQHSIEQGTSNPQFFQLSSSSVSKMRSPASVSPNMMMNSTFGWTSSFEKGALVDKDTLIFLGESSPLSFLVRRLQESGHVTIHKLPQVEPEISERMSDRSSSIVSNQSAASSLPPNALKEVLTSYFQIVHPFYPVIARQWFCDKYFKNDIPPLLLNSVCFAACYHCPMSVIFQMGYPSREKAKEVFYLEAKRLFDEDQEDDIVVVLQAVILLSFYGGKTRRVWNSRSWLAIAITIAEEMGLHRLTSRIKMNEADKCHLKIIWWCIVFRDFFTSLSYGRPPKTHDPNADTELLTVEDFDWDPDPDDPMFGRKDAFNCHFLVEYAKLNRFMGKVIQMRYCAYYDIRQSTLDKLYDELTEWRQSLPPCLDWTINTTHNAARYTCMGFHHMCMFIYRPRSTDPDFIDKRRAVESASAISTIVGKLGVDGTNHIPQDMFQIITVAVAILLSDFAKSDVTNLQVQICLMILNQAKENWDHAQWIVSFFERLQLTQPDQPDLSIDSFDFLKLPIEQQEAATF